MGDYESLEDEDDDDLMDEEVLVDCEGPSTTATAVLNTLNGKRDNYLGEQSTSRGDDVKFVLPPDENEDAFVLQRDLLLPGDELVLPPNLPTYDAEVPVLPPDKFSKDYVSRGGSPQKIK